ncbi:hypothetical protein EXIGLDRAFT_768655 [Exidia glandulosa HHB12029]|uniref:Uncharacterized protein n=1 Tax=Exidia glandulosa HHB12029 TaxID=1314781 RepID=A0A165I332_EXIGL|nr:hypothetical protein EXIGLDRAFT_768655 [Exidia glandulosa HHB12029]
MPTIEAPVVSDWPVPPAGSETYGQFVIVSFDPVASVAVFEDNESTAVASTLPRVKHLALVTSVRASLSAYLDAYSIVSQMGRPSPMNDDGRNLLTLEFQLLGLGLHSDEDATGRTSIPVAPQTSHPLNRPSIVPSIPLPWPGFYLYTQFKVASLVSRVHYEPEQPYPYITLDQRRDIFVQSLKDERESVLPQQPAAPLDFGNHSEYDSVEGSMSAESSEESSRGHDDDNPELTALYNKTEDVDPYVEIWTDLSSVAHPSVFGKPMDILPQLDWLKEYVPSESDLGVLD